MSFVGFEVFRVVVLLLTAQYSKFDTADVLFGHKSHMVSFKYSEEHDP